MVCVRLLQLLTSATVESTQALLIRTDVLC